MDRTVERNAFRSFERAGWQRVFEDYHEAFAGLTVQAVNPLLDVLRAAPGRLLLDVATGPGYVASAARKRGVRVTAVDFARAMLTRARDQCPVVAFCEADAEDLPFATASFDAVAMNFGLLHLGEPERAIAEAFRVLARGGRFGFTVWCEPREAVGFGLVLDAVQRYGELNVPLPPAPPFFHFSDREICIEALLEAGFVLPEIQRIPQIWRLTSPGALFDAMRGATVRTAGMLRAQEPQALEAIANAVSEATAAYRVASGIELPMPAVLASAMKS